MNFTKEDHTFAICAYKDSPFLEQCIQSLNSQSIKSNILLATSTPSSYIESICNKYHIQIYINPEQSGIAADWNFAVSKARTGLVTIVHQDDIYEPDYLKNILQYANECKKPILIFTDYYECRNEIKVSNNILLSIKRILNTPLRLSFLRGSRRTKRFCLSFGSPICCPSVTYALKNIPYDKIFDVKLKNNCDYQAFINLSDLNGEFVYCSKLLVGHRIHLESATSDNISSGIRQKEDIEILRQLWPKPIANFIYHIYRLSEKSNHLNP